MKFTHTLAALCAATLFSATASAAVLSYSFAGNVTDDPLASGYTTFTGSFNFESTTPDSILDPSTAAYAHTDPTWGVGLVFNGTDAVNVFGGLNILITNNLGGTDQFGVLAQQGSSNVSITLVDATQAAFNSDALPVAPLTLANFASRTLSWETPAGTLQGTLTSLTLNTAPIPEPGTLPMLALGLAATAWAARRRMR